MESEKNEKIEKIEHLSPKKRKLDQKKYMGDQIDMQ